MIRILIVDDHPVVRAGLKALLAEDPDFQVVGVAGTVREAEALFASLRPDLTLMDIQLPDGDGLALLRALKPQGGRLVILTNYGGPFERAGALLAGADAFLQKDLDPRVLLATLKRLMNEGRLPAAEPAPAASLSERELQVLRLLGTGASNQEIGERLGISRSTAKAHVEHILLKLNAKTRAQAVQLASGSLPTP